VSGKTAIGLLNNLTMMVSYGGLGILIGVWTILLEDAVNMMAKIPVLSRILKAHR